MAEKDVQHPFMRIRELAHAWIERAPVAEVIARLPEDAFTVAVAPPGRSPMPDGSNRGGPTLAGKAARGRPNRRPKSRKSAKRRLTPEESAMIKARLKGQTIGSRAYRKIQDQILRELPGVTRRQVSGVLMVRSLIRARAAKAKAGAASADKK